GASFTVRLPLGTPAAAARRNDGARFANPDLRGVTVLLVDDEADARELTARILREHHADVHDAGSVAQALHLLDQVHPDVLVSDIGMPDADGFDLLAQVRARACADAARLPALALTAFAQQQDRQRALDSGFQAWISKPLDPAELVAAVAQLAAPRREPGYKIPP
ncbi:MAG: response regulator, partial [Janthinobacterium sp.]